MARWVFLLGLGLLLVAGALLVTCAVLGPPPGVTEANVRRIRPGMAPTDARRVVGIALSTSPSPQSSSSSVVVLVNMTNKHVHSPKPLLRKRRRYSHSEASIAVELRIASLRDYSFPSPAAIAA